MKIQVRNLINRFLPYLSLIVLFVVLSVIAPNFLTAGNLSSIVRQSAVITVMAIGMTMIIIAGAIDLSVGSLMGLAAICGTMALSGGSGAGAAMLISVVAGVALGTANGLLTTVLKIPSFIATLGTMGIYRGLALYWTNGIPITDLPRSFGTLAEGRFLAIPHPAWVLIVLAVLGHLVLTRTKIGRYCFATGSNRRAAIYSGVPVDRYLVFLFAISGGLAGLAGMIESSRLITGQPTAGQGYELLVIAAVVIGGGSLSGGEGSILGTIAGAFTMGLLSNGCNLLGISPFVQQILIGTIIVLAVSIDNYHRRKKI
ncbi:MAG: ABC transporter permease [Acidobacteriota bacterium]